MTVLKEGAVGGALNLYFIYKFLRILTTPFASTEAFKLGIIDEKGKILKKKSKLKTIAEKEAYTMMHRLVWKLKRLMEKVPFGKTRLASYAAALWLIKEENEFDGTDQELQESFLSFLETDWESDALILKENYEGDTDKKTFENLREGHKKGHKLPPHLAKFFDKKGNLKKDAADRVRKGRAQRGVKITDVTPDWMFPEEAPPGWEGTVKAMKKKKNIDNPYALAWHMHNKGMKPHIPEEFTGENMKSFKELEEAVLANRDYKYDGKVVKISKKNFSKVHKDFKGTTKGKETMLVLDPKSGGTILVPVQFEEVELDEAAAFHLYPKRNKVGDEIEKLASKGGAEADKLFVIATALQKGRIPNKFIRELSPKRKKEVHAIMKDFGWKELPEEAELDEVFNVGKMSDKKLKDFIGQFDPDERMGQAAAMRLKAARKEAQKRGIKLEEVEFVEEVDADEKLVYKLKIKPKKVKKLKDLRLYANPAGKRKSTSKGRTGYSKYSDTSKGFSFGKSKKTKDFGYVHFGTELDGDQEIKETTAPGEPEDKIAEKIYSILAKNGIKNPEFREGNLYVPKKDVKKANVVLKKAGMLKHFNGLIGEAKYYTPSARDLKDYERWAKTQKAIGPRPVLDVKDIEQWTMEIYKGIKAGWKSVSKSTLGGDENVAIMIKVTVEPEKEWPNKILQNASYGMIRIATDGTMEMFASGHKLKNMRKTKIKTPRDIIKKINDWIKSVSEEIAPHARVMAKQGDSAKEIKDMHPEITDDELKGLGVEEELQMYEDMFFEEYENLEEDDQDEIDSIFELFEDGELTEDEVIEGLGSLLTKRGRTQRKLDKLKKKQAKADQQAADEKEISKLKTKAKQRKKKKKAAFKKTRRGKALGAIGRGLKKLGGKVKKAFGSKKPEKKAGPPERKKLKVSSKYRRNEFEVSTFTDFITEGRPALDPDFVPARTQTDAMRAKLLSTQKRLYSAKDIESMARKYKVKLDGPPVGGKSWGGDWEIVLKNGVSLSYEYGPNSTYIKGWKFDRKAIKSYIGKYANEHETPRDYAPMGGKVLVGGLEAAFEVITEGSWKPGKYKITDEKGKILLVVKGGGKAQKHVDKLMQTGDYDKLTVELVDEELKEEAPANSVASGNVNLDPFKKKRKNAKVQTETFAGQKVFVVSPERFYDSRLGKSRYLRYEKFVGNDKLGEAIRTYGRENPKAAIILKNSVNGAMLYLKYGRK